MDHARRGRARSHFLQRRIPVTDSSRSDAEASVEIDDRSSAVRRIELQWPEKGKIPVRRPDGAWQLIDPPEGRVQIPFVPVDRFAGATASRRDSLVVEGRRLDVLSTLRRTVTRSVRLAYLDLPRIIVDDKTRAFQGEPNRTWSTYLSFVREHVRGVLPLLAREGVVVAQCGDAEEPYVRMVLTEAFGPQNHVGTIVWQRSFAPRNPKNMNQFTATHDPIIIFAIEKESLPRVALDRTPQGFGNPDGDPRGMWRVVRQKGAATRREKTDFGVNRPPYRWRLVDGQLPPGFWRVSPMTGVIWGEPSAPGTYRFTVEVTDSAGNSATAELEISVVAEGEEAPLPIVPWLFDKDSPPAGSTADQRWSGVTAGDRALKITTKTLPRAVVGQKKYAVVIEAAGGQPFTGPKLRPKAPRNYEFTWPRLLDEMLSDKVDFGAKGDAVPRLRVHGNPETDIEWVNQQTWWPGSVVKKSDWSTGEDEGVGFTADATKHLQRLLQRGLIEEAVKTAKPELLLGRLVRIFTRPGDVVIEMFGESADLAAVATKLDRRFILLAGNIESELRLLSRCALPRLRAVILGTDIDNDHGNGRAEGDNGEAEGSGDNDSRKTRRSAALPYKGGGAVSHLRLDEPLAEFRPGQEYTCFVAGAAPENEHDLKVAILTGEGFLPVPLGQVDGESFNGRIGAIVLGPQYFLDQATLSRICSTIAPAYEGVVVYFFRSADDLNPELMSRAVLCKRVPMDLSL